MIEDLRKNKRMKIFSTESGFGEEAISEKQRQDNPLLQNTKFKDVNGIPLLANDIFRFVHDFFGHAKLGNGFGAVGEENAWNVHSKMYSPLAKRAMTTETRGQNSWVNFSGINDEAFKKRDQARELRAQGKVEEAKKLIGEVYEQMSFAEQKVGLLPNWVSDQDLELYNKEEQKDSEPKLSEVLNFVTTQNQNTEPLNKEQKLELQNFSIGVPNFSTQKLVDAFFDENGMFSVNPQKLKESGLYNDYEISNLQSNVELQKTVKSTLEALKNTTEEIDLNQEEFDFYKEVTNDINSFGKMTYLNPYAVQKTIAETLGGTTEQEFYEKLSDLDYPNFQSKIYKEQLFQEMQNFSKADVLQEVDGEIKEALVEDTAVIMPQVVKDNVSPVLMESIKTFLNIDQDILDNNPAQVEVLLQSIEDGLVSMGIDVIGMQGKTNIKPFLATLSEFLSTPTTDSFNDFISIYDEMFEKDKTPQKTVIKTEKKDREYVKLNTNKSEEQLYTEQGLIKVEDGTYIRVNPKSLEELYTIMQTYPEKFPDENIQQYVQKEVGNMEDIINPEVGEAIFLFKTYFDIANEGVVDIDIPRYLYHTTPSSNTQSIKKNGLLVAFDNRIYLTKNLGSVINMANQLHQAYKNEDIKFYGIWRIDTEKLNNPIFFKDEDYNAGIYITKPIPKNAIKYYESTKVESLAESNNITFQKTISTKNNVNFTGNEQYLTTEFVSDFYIEGLKEKQKDSLKWKQFYRNFGINAQGLYLKNDDPLTIQAVNEFADENLRNYSLLSKQMPNLEVKEEIAPKTLQNRRDSAINNPKSVEKFKGQIYQVTDSEVISKNGNKEFIRINNDIFEAIDTEGQLTLYSKVEKKDSQYNQFNTEQPQTELELEDYSHLETTPEKFVETKNYVSAKKIIEENFDCI
jgi:hypothetical protein